MQGLVRRLRKAGGFTNHSCGIHVHLDGANHTPRSIRNFVNIITSHNDLFYKALQIEPERMNYCKKMDAYLVERMNRVKGREEKTVVLDEERAPLIKLAFEEYATGNWTVEDLAEHLATCGLTTRATPNVPSAPIDRKALYKVLANRYYTGILSFKGVEYPGIHPALVCADVWQQVQDVLASHANGERTREHPHFLKGSLYCHNCGSRMFINYTKARSGVRYPYFVCGGRHNKVTNYKQKAVLISEVERRVEQIYDHYSFPPAVREYLENYLQNGIQTEQQKYESELEELRREKDKLERQRKKLLEAHYNDAIPMDLLKEEQQKITKQLAAIEHQVKAQTCTFATIKEHLRDALDLIEDCGKTYRLADDYVKRMMNQAIFSKLWIEEDGQVTAEFTPLFQMIAKPLENVAAHCKQQKIRGTEVLTDFLSVISNRFQNFFGDGWSNALLAAGEGFEFYFQAVPVFPSSHNKSQKSLIATGPAFPMYQLVTASTSQY